MSTENYEFDWDEEVRKFFSTPVNYEVQKVAEVVNSSPTVLEEDKQEITEEAINAQLELFLNHPKYEEKLNTNVIKSDNFANQHINESKTSFVVRQEKTQNSLTDYFNEKMEFYNDKYEKDVEKIKSSGISGDDLVEKLSCLKQSHEIDMGKLELAKAKELNYPQENIDKLHKNLNTKYDEYMDYTQEVKNPKNIISPNSNVVNNKEIRAIKNEFMPENIKEISINKPKIETENTRINESLNTSKINHSINSNDTKEKTISSLDSRLSEANMIHDIKNDLSVNSKTLVNNYFINSKVEQRLENGTKLLTNQEIMQRSIDSNLTPTDYDQGWSKIEKQMEEDYNNTLSKLTSGDFTMAQFDLVEKSHDFNKALFDFQKNHAQYNMAEIFQDNVYNKEKRQFEMQPSVGTLDENGKRFKGVDQEQYDNLLNKYQEMKIAEISVSHGNDFSYKLDRSLEQNEKSLKIAKIQESQLMNDINENGGKNIDVLHKKFQFENSAIQYHKDSGNLSLKSQFDNAKNEFLSTPGALNHKVDYYEKGYSIAGDGSKDKFDLNKKYEQSQELNNDKPNILDNIPTNKSKNIETPEKEQQFSLDLNSHQEQSIANMRNLRSKNGMSI